MPNDISNHLLLSGITQEIFTAAVAREQDSLYSRTASWRSFSAYLEYLERLICLNPSFQYMPQHEIELCLSSINDLILGGMREKEKNEKRVGILKDYCLLLRVLMYQKKDQIAHFAPLDEIASCSDMLPMEEMLQLFKLMYDQGREANDLCMTFLKEKLISLISKRIFSKDFKENEIVIDFLSLLAEKKKFSDDFNRLIKREDFFRIFRLSLTNPFSLEKIIYSLVKNDYSNWVLEIWKMCREDPSREIEKQIKSAIIGNEKTNENAYKEISFKIDLTDIFLSSDKVVNESYLSSYISDLKTSFSGRMKETSPYWIFQKDFSKVVSKGTPFIIERLKQLEGKYFVEPDGKIQKVPRDAYLAKAILYQLLLLPQWEEVLDNETFLTSLKTCLFSCDFFSLYDFLSSAELKNKDIFPKVISSVLMLFLKDIFQEPFATGSFLKNKHRVSWGILRFCRTKHVTLEPQLIEHFHAQLAKAPALAVINISLFPESFSPESLAAAHINTLGVFVLPLLHKILHLETVMGSYAATFMAEFTTAKELTDFLSQCNNQNGADCFDFYRESCHSLFKRNEILKSNLSDKKVFILLISKIISKYCGSNFRYKNQPFFLLAKEKFSIDVKQAKTMQEACQIASRLEPAIYALDLFLVEKEGFSHAEISTKNLLSFEKFYWHYEKINLRNTDSPRHQLSFDIFTSELWSELRFLYTFMQDKTFEFLKGFIASSVMPLVRFMSFFNSMLKHIPKDNLVALLGKKFLFSPEGFIFKAQHSEATLFFQNLMMLFNLCASLSQKGKWENYIQEIEAFYFINLLLNKKIEPLTVLAKEMRALKENMEKNMGESYKEQTGQVIEKIERILNISFSWKNFQNFFIGLEKIEFLEKLSEKKSLEERKLFLLQKRKDFSMKPLLARMEKMLAESFSVEIGISSQQYEKKSKQISQEALFGLLQGMKAIDGSGFDEVYRALLQIFFDPNTSFKDFVLDGIEGSTISRDLSKHNKNIIEELKTHGIKAELLLQYDKRSHFTAAEGGLIDVENSAHTVWKNLCAFKNVDFPRRENETSSELSELINTLIENIKPLIRENPALLSDFLTEEKHQIALEEIVSLIKKILADSQIKKAPSFVEFGQHVIDAQSLLRKMFLESKTLPQKSDAVENFSVEIWDKSKLETFLLGQFVGCCLSPMGGQFPAIVQRCADIGMFFPVVIDQKSGEPIACNWAFFAKASDKKIYLVINFFEIRASFSRDASLSNTIVDSLLQFTRTYANELGVKDVLIRPLTYGNIPDFIGLESRSLTVQKVGGFFKPTASASDYYLVALDKNEFHYVPSLPAKSAEGKEEINLSENGNRFFAKSPVSEQPLHTETPTPGSKK